MSLCSVNHLGSTLFTGEGFMKMSSSTESILTQQSFSFLAIVFLFSDELEQLQPKANGFSGRHDWRLSLGRSSREWAEASFYVTLSRKYLF